MGILHWNPAGYPLRNQRDLNNLTGLSHGSSCPIAHPMGCPVESSKFIMGRAMGSQVAHGIPHGGGNPSMQYVLCPNGQLNEKFIRGLGYQGVRHGMQYPTWHGVFNYCSLDRSCITCLFTSLKREDTPSRALSRKPLPPTAPPLLRRFPLGPVFFQACCPARYGLCFPPSLVRRHTLRFCLGLDEMWPMFVSCRLPRCLVCYSRARPLEGLFR